MSLFRDGPESMPVSIRSIVLVDLDELVDASESLVAVFGAEVCEKAFMMASLRAAAALSSSGVFGLPVLRAGAEETVLVASTFVGRVFEVSFILFSLLYGK